MRAHHNLLLFVCLLMISLSSCVSHKELISFKDGPKSTTTPEQIQSAMNLRIQPEDLLRIQIHSHNPKAAAPFNVDIPTQQNAQLLNQQGDGGNYSLELFTGYLVDQDGYIDFPVIGPIELEGLTLEQAKGKIYELVRPYITDVVVNIRLLNFKITVLGEVNIPGVKRLSNKRVTILEALGMAGDLTDYANRKNILIVREEDGKRSNVRLNLQSGDIFDSPYFYLQQNDLIYVEPLQVRVATVSDPLQRIISYSSAGITLITLIITLSR